MPIFERFGMAPVAASRPPPRRNPCRCLFPAAASGDEPNDAFVKRLLADMRDEQARKWGYDFEASRPLAGCEQEFVYEPLPADSVPGFYRMSSYGSVDEDKENSSDGYYDAPTKAGQHDVSGIIPTVDYEDDASEKMIDRRPGPGDKNGHRAFCWSIRPAVGPRTAPATLRAVPTARRLFDASLGDEDDFDLSFEDLDDEEDDDLPLLNDSTSSSGSEPTVSTVTPVKRTGRFETADRLDSTIEGLLRSAKRSSTAVTPKKQSRMIEFMACRKRLQLSAFNGQSIDDSNDKSVSDKNRVILSARRRRPAAVAAGGGTPVSSRYRKRPANDEADEATTVAALSIAVAAKRRRAEF